MRIRTVPTVLAAALLAVAACGGGDGPRRASVAARSYYEDYPASAEENMNRTAGAPQPATDGAAQPATTVVPEPLPPGPLEDNTFVDVGDSTFVATADDAESTFALDVDTGSFAVAQAFLDEGTRPDPDAIRTEEWLNAFDYGDPAPTEDALGVTVEAGPAPRADDGTALVRIGVTTQELATEDRPPANLTFVIDTSGSMDIRERLGLVKSSLALLVQHLRDDDSIAIVTYGDDATPVLEPTPVADAERIIAAIDELQPGGSTNMEAGLRQGYEQARRTLRPDALNVVVLASDGVANVGVTDASVLTDEITQAGEEGVHLVTVGYGMGNYNDALMEQLADRGDGFYSYVDTFEEAERLFVDELTPTLTVVAAEAKAQVVFDPAVVAEYRLVGYENRGLDDEKFRDDTVDAGELGAGHAVTALYEVRFADRSAQPLARVAPVEAIGEVRLRWTSPESGQTTETTAAITMPGGEVPSEAFRLAATVADLAEVLKGNSVVAERGIELSDLRAEAQSLADSGVPGATDLVAVIVAAQSADPF
ncbi:MAG: YfbK domain-containing protein [Ilumatobacteraceae bacterium]